MLIDYPDHVKFFKYIWKGSVKFFEKGRKESNGFSVALFLYLYAAKSATPLTKMYSVFAVFKL